MSADRSQLPIIIGVGQSVVRELPAEPLALPTPATLATTACERALADAAAGLDAAELARAVDTLAFVRINSDSMPRPSPLGRCNNLPRQVAGAIGAAPARAVYSIVGGQSPQQLVNEYATRLARGDCELVLLTGAEAIGAMKHIRRQGLNVSWDEQIDGQLEDRGLGPELFEAYEIANGLGFPPQVYGAMENAWRAGQGHDKAAHQKRMSALFAPFSEVAADNPFAQFPLARSAEFLATPSRDNYRVADPYLKWHIAQDAVNQGAALLLTTVGKAQALKVPEERWVYCLEGADAQDKVVSRRPDLARSAAMSAVLDSVLQRLYVEPAEIAYMDLYSCFPCAVQFACDALGIDPFAGAGPGRLTLTGGLPYFGGAGNNYSMHAIATLVDLLRADPGALGLVLANGGFASKESAGLYSTVPNLHWQPLDNASTQIRIDAVADVPRARSEQGGRIESYSVVYKDAQPFIGYAFARTADGGRFMARTERGDEQTLQTLIEDDPIGLAITPRGGDKYNVLDLN